MAQVTVRINGYAYTVGCEDGQEEHLAAMAEQIDTRINSIRALGGQSGESRLLVLAALLMADELHDLGMEMTALRRSKPGAAPSAAKTDAAGRKMAQLARRAEEIAATMEQP